MLLKLWQNRIILAVNTWYGQCSPRLKTSWSFLFWSQVHKQDGQTNRENDKGGNIMPLPKGITTHKNNTNKHGRENRATVMCCAYAQKVHCAVVGSCYTSRGPCTEHVCLCLKVGVFRRGWATFGEYLTGKGASPTNDCWCHKTRVIAVSCGIKISTVLHLVLSQYKAH